MATQETIVVHNFYEVPDNEAPSIPLIVVYENPSDFPPGSYVARLWYLNRPTAYAVVRKSFKEIEELIPPHMVQLQVSFQDDPIIIATYV